MEHALGPGAEFDAVRRLVRGWGDLAAGIGDDAAVLDVPPGERLVVSTDASVERVHFRREWLTPAQIGARATTSALSDLAAMGAAALGIVVALVVPAAWRPDLDAVAAGIGEAVAAAGTRIVGGDMSSGAELSITVTVFGTAARPVTRAGAQVGDDVFVTGLLGGPLLALRALQRGEEPTHRAHRLAFAAPVARLGEGRWLAARGATAMIDVSDGLAADLRHVAAASGVRLRVELGALPRVAGASPLDALASGEEYALAACVPPGAVDVTAFEQAFSTSLTRIGTVEAAVPGGTLVVVDDAGGRVDLPPGHDHFSS
jgi:thiamine-monophosphate kinase